MPCAAVRGSRARDVDPVASIQLSVLPALRSGYGQHVSRLVERGRSLVAVLALLAVGLSGCASDPAHPAVSADVVAHAASKTTHAGPAHVVETFSGRYNGRDLGDGSLSGVIDQRRGLADLDFDLRLLAKLSSKVDAELLKGRMIVMGDILFANVPGYGKLLPDGKHWVEGTQAQVEADPGPTGGLAGVGNLDPTKPVDHLRAVREDAADLGAESVGGAAAHHYGAKLDYRDYVPLAPRADRPGLTKAADMIEETLGTSTLPIDVWIAGDGTIRRLKGTISARGLHLEYVIDITELGAPVHIKPPPRDEVVDARGQ
jgi:hypothetical protein